MSEESKYIRIMKGEIGPNATQEEANRMAQTIYNREHHPDVAKGLTNAGAYQTLRYPAHDYQLTPAQNQVFKNAYNSRTSGNHGNLGWDTTRNSIPSTNYYTWTAEPNKCGGHYFYNASKRK